MLVNTVALTFDVTLYTYVLYIQSVSSYSNLHEDNTTDTGDAETDTRTSITNPNAEGYSPVKKLQPVKREENVSTSQPKLNDKVYSEHDKETKEVERKIASESDEVQNKEGTESSSELQLFSARQLKYTLVPTNCDRSADINSVATSILQYYKPIESRRQAINDSLIKFKTTLGMSEEMKMDQCLGKLRVAVGDKAELELLHSGDEPIKLKFRSGMWSVVDNSGRDAVSHFNSILNNCQKIRAEQELKLADIHFKLDDLQLMPLTKEGQELYKALNQIPTFFDHLSSDIAALYKSIMDNQHILT